MQSARLDMQLQQRWKNSCVCPFLFGWVLAGGKHWILERHPLHQAVSVSRSQDLEAAGKFNISILSRLGLGLLKLQLQKPTLCHSI